MRHCSARGGGMTDGGLRGCRQLPAVPFRATGFGVRWAAEAAMGLQPATVAFEANKMAEWLTLMSPCRIPA